MSFLFLLLLLSHNVKCSRPAERPVHWAPTCTQYCCYIICNGIHMVELAEP